LGQQSTEYILPKKLICSLSQLILINEKNIPCPQKKIQVFFQDKNANKAFPFFMKSKNFPNRFLS
jgi:hypothetical protein